MLCLIVILNIDLELGDVTKHDVMVIKNISFYSIILTGMQRFISPQCSILCFSMFCLTFYFILFCLTFYYCLSIFQLFNFVFLITLHKLDFIIGYNLLHFKLYNAL